ncbi:MAG: DUF3341 domain-containing protein [Saprospiraceae bacterium]|jgi:hypothetical protein|nr:DUF3341 domain-containing protein [Saprospiraceae bacterium]HRD79495.1 DUF3341 domain-containing protein [Saprospiraceae bacterium]HRF38509.1 DUF3341 domain-containing protein [Saprospiraceae bacterium]HRJ13361.1 DUF3341 domain-containing protein [Saprospiraceae bacterium]HRK81841.1 DUF3341 domain-containing protein [Saprospiraceae bacterium]
MKHQKEVIYGLYDDEEILLRAVKKAQADHIEIMDVFTPFPVHGLDKAMGLEESRLHIAGFAYGLTGTLTAFLFMTWVFTRDWPIIFGGKPYWSVPSFIPITFEVTVLFAAIGMVVSFFTVCGMAPGRVNPTLDDRITDDKFCIAFNAAGAEEEERDRLRSFLSGTGASEVNMKTI